MSTLKLLNESVQLSIEKILDTYKDEECLSQLKAELMKYHDQLSDEGYDYARLAFSIFTESKNEKRWFDH
jgi:hypothetical protein